MSEESPKDRKSGSPKKLKAERLKAKGDAKPDEENHSAINTPHSELNETLTTDNSPLTTQMEVHHHPDLHHKEKPWKEYLLEGLMIFVAVTMGFFAESLREHIANRDKEKEIIASLVRDLKKDTSTLNNLINIYMPYHNHWVDSADNYINTPQIKGNEQKITMGLFNATDWVTYAPPEVALNNLKSSGTFNLIEKDKVKSEILNFNTRINEYLKYSEFVTGVEHCVDTASMSIMDRKVQRRVIERLYVNNAVNKFGFVVLKDIPNDVKFKTYNKQVFINFFKKVEQADNLLNDMLGQYKRIYAAEVKLLKVLKEEYNLDDE